MTDPDLAPTIRDLYLPWRDARRRLAANPDSAIASAEESPARQRLAEAMREGVVYIVDGGYGIELDGPFVKVVVVEDARAR